METTVNSPSSIPSFAWLRCVPPNCVYPGALAPEY